MTPGFAKPRSELPWLPYGEQDRVIINAHNFNPSYLYPSLRTTPPVLGYYPRLDSGAAATDQFTADGAQDGTLRNGATRADSSGLAYSFTAASSQYIDCAVPSGLSGAGDCTLAFWAKKAATGDELTIGTRISGTNGVWLQWFTDNFLYFSPRNGGTSTAAAFVAFSTAWRHVCGVKQGTTIRAYINGSLITSSTGPANLPALSVFNVGRLETGGFYSNGLIDDPLVFAKALDATDVGYLAAQRGAIYATA
jgi:hypothetical protein